MAALEPCSRLIQRCQLRSAREPANILSCNQLSYSRLSLAQRLSHPQQRTCKSVTIQASTDAIGATATSLTPHSGYHYDGRKGRFFEVCQKQKQNFDTAERAAALNLLL